MIDLDYLATATEAEILARRKAEPEWWKAITQQFSLIADQEVKETQVHFYSPANPMAAPVHDSLAREIAILGGNRSSKTTTMLAEFAIRMTGHIPQSLLATYPLEKIKGPIRTRLVCNSLTDTLVPVIIPKLRWDHWNGVGDPKYGRGHWGFIPRHCIKDGTWEKAYSTQHRTLYTAFCTRCIIAPHSAGQCRFCEAKMPLVEGRGHTWPQNWIGTSTLQFLCLDPTTGVLLPDGTWVRLQDVKVGDIVATSQGPRVVDAVHHYESAPRVRIRIWSGPDLIATPNHRHKLSDGQWKTSEELRVGDVLALANVEPDKCDPLAEEWRLGWTAILIGDGSLTGGSLAFTAVPGSRAIRNLPPLPPGYELVDAPTPTQQHRLVRAGRKRGPWDNPLGRSIQRDGLWGLKSYEKFVPAWVFRQPREGVEAFLRHLWNTDGTGPCLERTYEASVYTTTSHQLALDVQRLIWRLGFSAGVSSFQPKLKVAGYNAMTGTPIISRRRVYRVQTCWTPGRLRGKIRSIEAIEPGPVACLTVNGAHEFIANGVVTGNSYDQDLSAFAGSSMHLVGHDELPPADIYRENRMRTLDVRGQIITAFTPPDEIGMARGDVTWFYDEVYEPGLKGPNKHPDIDTFVLFTEKNRILSAADINALASRMTEEQREVRLYGRFIHLSGVIYALFTSREAWWCMKCSKRILPVNRLCASCGTDDLVEFSHVCPPFDLPRTWPVLMVIDPHPRKKDAIGWFAVTPSDDVVMVGELEVEGTAQDVARAVREYEDRHRLYPIKRLMDPNIATESNDKMQRGWTLRRAYDDVGLRCDLANDDMHMGIQAVSDLLKPDKFTRQPRLRFTSACENTIYSMSRWAWDEYTRQGDKEPKERPRDRHKDFCDVVRYAIMDHPTFHGYQMGGVLRHRDTGRGRRGY